MLGTFRIGDLLILELVPIIELCKGDVIVFRESDSEDHKNELVHRIISISKENIVTRGDNNLRKDKILITEKNLLGKVVKIERGNKTLNVRNGWSGLVVGKAHHLKLSIKKMIWGTIRLPYNKLKKSNITSKVWKPKILKTTIQTSEGELVKYIHNNKTVGYLWTETGKSKIKKPYDLIIGSRKSEVRR